EYASERLKLSGETEVMRRRHAEYFVSLAERAEPELRLSPHQRWFRRFEREQDNLRDVLEWSLNQGDPAVGIRLVSAIWLFWFAYGHHVEGFRWTKRLLPHLNETPEEQHAKFLNAAGNMALNCDFESAKPLFLRALDISRQLEDRLNTAWALIHLATAMSSEA